MTNYLRIKEALNHAISDLQKSGIPSPELDSGVLLEAATDKDSVFTHTHPNNPLTNIEYTRFRRYIRRRKKGEPVAYILGHKEFYGLDFIVSKNVLIPRPETEWLVEAGIGYLVSSIWQRSKSPNQKPQIPIPKYQILDLGTGSGNIIISIAKSLSTVHLLPSIKLCATDVSSKALNVARKNAKKHGVKKQIHFYCSDLFSNKRLPKKFDLIIANLPYVPRGGEWKVEGRKSPTDFEPQEAIFAGQNGSAIIKEFLRQANDRVRSGGRIILELDPRNAKELLKFASKVFSQKKIELQKDLAGKERYLIINV